MKSNTLFTHLAAIAATAGLFLATTAHSTTYTYGTVSGTDTELWSTGTGWNAVPVGAEDTALTLGGLFAADAAPVSENDLAGSFTLNTLTLGGTGPDSATASLTIGGNALRFAGTTPTVNLDASRGGGTAALTYFITAPVELAADTLFTGTGNALFRLDGIVSGTGGLTKSGGSQLILGAQNTFSGTTAVSGGTLRLGAGNALAAAGPIAVASGATLAASTVGTTMLNNLSGAGSLDLNGSSRTLIINQTEDGVWGGTTVDRRDGIATKQGGGKLSLTAANALQVEISLTVDAGEIELRNAGTIGINRRCRTLTLRQGTILTLDNTAANSNNRIDVGQGLSGKVPIIFQGSSLRHFGNDGVDTTERLVDGLNNNTSRAARFDAGGNEIIMMAGEDRSSIVSFRLGLSSQSTVDPLPRSTGASVLIAGTNLGSQPQNESSATRANSVNIVFTTNGATNWTPYLTDGIMPGYIAARIDPTTAVYTYGLATHDSGTDEIGNTADDVGIRPLAAGELSASLGAGLNVKATSALTNDGSAINALHLDAGGSIADGGATLTVSSGTILSTGAANAIGGTVGNDTLAFGTSEGIFYNAPGSTLTVNTTVTGSGGLTKGGDGTLVLKATSGTGQYTGTTYINGGVLSIDGNSALGAVATGSGIQLNNGGVLRSTATFTLDNTGNNRRTIVVGGTTANTITSGGIDVVGGEALTVSGVVSGVGRLIKTGPGSLTLMTANNTWSGGTTVAAGRLVIDGNTSNHGDVEILDGATLAGTWGASKTLGLAAGRTLRVASGGTLEIDAANAPQAVTGNLDLSAAGDILAITGTASDEIVLLTYTGTLTGTFDSVTGLPANLLVDYTMPGQVLLSKPKGTILLLR